MLIQKKILIFSILLIIIAVFTIVVNGEVAKSLYPVEWEHQGKLPSAPGDYFETDFFPISQTRNENSPIIAAWNKTVHPDESFTMTGTRFTLRDDNKAGSDTTVWVLADNELYQAKVWSVNENVIIATLPAEISFGMYFIWVQNEAGLSLPIALNRTEPQWLGPLGNVATPGETKRVFGRNLAANHGAETSYVYIKNIEKEEFIETEIKRVEPYSVEFKIPEELEEGTYEVYVHNSHGGKYGWGGPLELEIDSWVRGDEEIVISPEQSNLSVEIQEAIDYLTTKPFGGVVRLEEGVYNLESSIVLKPQVRFTGAGKVETIIRGNSVDVTAQEGANIIIENLTIESSIRPENLPVYDLEINNIHLSSGKIGQRGTIFGYRVAIKNSEIPVINDTGIDNWYYNNIITGVQDFDMGFRNFHHAGIYNDWTKRTVTEKNHFKNETPVDSEGNKIMESPLEWPPGWIARMYLAAGRGAGNILFSYNYIAHNTTENIFMEGNCGEMILFHGLDGIWFGQVKENQGKTMTMEADGLIDGQVVTLPRSAWTGRLISKPMNEVNIRVGAYVVITGGPGIGQARLITEVSGDEITVDSLWRVEPTSESTIVISRFLFRDNIIYKNDLDSFPEGYNLTTKTANRPISFWGNSWNNVAEGNISRGTEAGSDTWGLDAGPSYWNEFRNESYYEIYQAGILNLGSSQNNPVGPSTLGNTFRGGVVEITGSRVANPLLANEAAPLSGNIFENIKAKGTTTRGISSAPFSQGLFRNNEINFTSESIIPSRAMIIEDNSLPILSGNIYKNADITYDASNYSFMPIALHRVAHFQGEVEEELSSVKIPVANAGIGSMSLEVKSKDDWVSIIEVIQLEPETKGELEISVDTTNMEAGIHWGEVVLSAGEKEVIIGVRVELKGEPITSFNIY